MDEALATGAAVRAATTLGVVARLQEGPCSPEGIAAACGASLRGTRLLLAALGALGLAAEAEDGTFTATCELVALAQFPSLWDHLAEVVRTGRPAVAFDRPEVAAARYPPALRLLGDVLAADAEVAADRLARPRLRVLDVGAGSAPWSLALARRDPGCRCTALDLAATLEVTRAAAARHGCDGQFDYLPGDVFRLALDPGAYDLVIVANLCHLFDEDRSRRLLARLVGALRPGGVMAVVDVAVGGEAAGIHPGRQRWAALYALDLMVRTTGGRPHPFASYVRWLGDAGCGQVDRVPLPWSGLDLVTARRSRGSA